MELVRKDVETCGLTKNVALNRGEIVGINVLVVVVV